MEGVILVLSFIAGTLFSMWYVLLSWHWEWKQERDRAIQREQDIHNQSGINT